MSNMHMHVIEGLWNTNLFVVTSMWGPYENRSLELI